MQHVSSSVSSSDRDPTREETDMEKVEMACESCAVMNTEVITISTGSIISCSSSQVQSNKAFLRNVPIAEAVVFLSKWNEFGHFWFHKYPYHQ